MSGEKIYDVIIAGGGCAGLSAGIYAARAGMKTLIAERGGTVGGQAVITNDIRNYPGFSEISGAELMTNMLSQAKSFGAELYGHGIDGVELDGGIKRCRAGDDVLSERTFIAANGSSPKTAGFEGELEFTGKGVSRCAICDGYFYRGGEVFVVGGGESAAKEALYLAGLCRSVTVLVRKNRLACSAEAQKRLFCEPKVKVMFNTIIKRVSGTSFINSVLLQNTLSGEICEYKTQGYGDKFGVFVFVGYSPNTDIYSGLLSLDEHGYIITDEKMKTCIDGVFAAGDIRSKSLRQLVTAASDGAEAAMQAKEFIEHSKSVPFQP